MKKYFLPAITLFGTIITTSSCEKTETATETVYQPYTVPSTYNFSNADYGEATARVNMWSGLTTYLGKSTGRQLSQDTATYLWNNTNAAFTSEIIVNLPNTQDALNALTFNVSGKSADQAIFKSLIDSMVKVSESVGAIGLQGVPGKIGTRIFNYSGLEFNQLVAKGLMGSLVMSEAIKHLDNIATDDNITVVPGSGTAMEHDWDMAFGYVSLPKKYDSSITYTSTVIDRPLALGNYFGERGKYIKAGGKVFEAFLKGRAAIAAKDYATRDQAIATIKEMLEKTLAAACYQYSAIGQTSTDPAAKFHALSEGYGFALALKYRQANSTLTDANYQTLVNLFKTDFYELKADASNTKLKQAQDILTAAYGQLQP